MTTSTTSTGMPKITATSASVSTWSTPSISPPNAGDNPYIWRSSAPTGTVFIAVGALTGFILLCATLFLTLRGVYARSSAKDALSLSEASAGHDSFSQGGSREKNAYPPQTSDLRKSVSQGKIPLLYVSNTRQMSTTSINEMDGHIHSQEQLFSTLDATDNKRRSMFISPTAEVMGFKTSNHTLPIAANAATIPETERLNRHDRAESYDTNTDVSLQSPERGPHKAYVGRTKTVPSQFLESMFEN